MTHKFSPFRCLSKWFGAPWLILFVFGFWLGRFLCVGVDVVAVRGNKRVPAEVLIGDGKLVGTTPCRVRGSAGETVRLTLKHAGRTVTTRWTIDREHPDCIVEFPSQPMALIFVASDTEGREIEAIVEGKDIPRHTTEDRSRLTRVVGDTQTIRFQPRDRSYGAAREEKILWQDKQTFDRWVEGDLPRLLAELDPNYNKAAWDERRERLKRYSSEAAHEYPVIFPSPAGRRQRR